MTRATESGTCRRLRARRAVATALVVGTAMFAWAPPASAVAAIPTLAVFAGTGSAGAPTPGPATSSDLQSPFGVALDTDGNVYIADTTNQRIEKVTPAGTLSVIAGDGSSGAPTPGPATASSLQNPFAVAVDPSGNVYIADTTNQRVEKVTPAGTLSIVAGTGTAAQAIPGPAASSPLSGPFGLTTDSAGNLYIADTNNNQVEKVTPSGTLSVFAGNGTQAQPTPGPATSSSLTNPTGLAFANGSLYIADTGNERVDKVSSAGTLSIVAGNGSMGAATPGPATDSSLTLPHGVAVDPSGNVYIGDSFNARVEIVDPRGTLSFLAGTGSSGVFTPGPAGDSALSALWALALDSSGTLYVADDGNNVIETITDVVPDAPGAVTAALTGGHVDVQWTAPATGPTPADYTVTPIVDGVPGTPVVVAGTSYELADPVPGATYTFTVTANSAYGDGPASAPSNAVTIPVPPSSGYWLVAGDGGVFSYGPRFYGSTGNLRLNQPVFAMTATADGKGYWFVARDGGVFAYGDARFAGSVPTRAQVTNIVGMAADTRTGGYWLVADTGRIYAFGAPSFGSVPGLGKHVHDIVGIAATRTGLGYYVVGADGTVYPFGDATQQGEPSSLAHHAPIVGIAVDDANGGYWVAAADGGVYSYGAQFHGSAGAQHLAQPIVGIGATANGDGYYLVAADGGVFAYDAPYLGSMGGTHLRSPMVGIATAGDHHARCSARRAADPTTAVC
jgi:sugar lactone lactonase YvrE